MVTGHGSRVAEVNALVRGATDGEAKGSMAPPEPDWAARGARALRLLNGLLDRRSNGSADALGPDTVCAPPVRAPPAAAAAAAPAAMPATFTPTPEAVAQTLTVCFGPPRPPPRAPRNKRNRDDAAASSRMTATAAALGTDERDATDLLRAVARQRANPAGTSATVGAR